MQNVYMREVGIRDGLQSLATIMPAEQKVEWCRDAVAAGIGEIEVTSFVPPKLLPQFADARYVAEEALRIDGLTVAVLVPNLRGAVNAAEVGVNRINCVVSVSEGHNLSNLNRTRAAAIEEFGKIAAEIKTRDEPRPTVVAGMANCFGCSIDGPVSHDEVRKVAAQLLELGAEEFLIADTVGYGNPVDVGRLFALLRQDLGKEIRIGAHFHDTRGTGLANVCAALEAGIIHFDASLGGLGGCPFAPGATGNIVMEDAVYMLESMGFRTGIDLKALLDLRRKIVGWLPGERFEGTLARAGLPKGFQQQFA